MAAAESRLQELNQLSAEIMDTGSPEQTRFVTATATEIAVRLLQLQSDINDNGSLAQYNAQFIHDFERRNTESADNAHADMSPSSITNNYRAETSYSLPDDRRAETSQQLQFYNPNCGYNNLHHRPRHSQPNMSSAITQNYSESNEHPTNRQDVVTETRIYDSSPHPPSFANNNAFSQCQQYKTMIVNNFGDAGAQLSTDTTIEIDDDVSSETVVYNQ